MIPTARYPDLAGRSVLVTGGADGIGRATVEAFAAQGAHVGFLDIDTVRGAALAEALGPAVRFEPCDLRDIAALLAGVERLAAAMGPAAVLVNNAGHDERHAFAAVTPDYWDDRMAVNLRPMMFAAQAVAPAMAAAGGGAIVNLGSTSWMQGAAGMIAYTTAKSAVTGFTRSLARELGRQKIRVNCVTPGWVMTERQLTRWATPEKLALQQAKQSLDGQIEPGDIAAMVLYLASADARMVTGQNFIVDAGTV